MTAVPKHSARRRADRSSGHADARRRAGLALPRRAGGLPGNDEGSASGAHPLPGGRYLAEEIAAGAAVLPLLRAAVRRQAVVWCATAITGLALGLGFYTTLTPRYGASISVQLSQDPSEDIFTDIVVAQSRNVAANAAKTLQSRESPARLQASYTVQWLSRKILLFQVSGDSPHEAVREATALAEAFLRFRGAQIRERQQAIVTGLSAQISQARARVSALTGQTGSQAAQQSGHARPAELDRLNAQLRLARTDLASLQQGAPVYETNVRAQTTSLLVGNKVLNPAAALPPSVLRRPDVLGLTGAAGGLVLGLGLVMIAALVSNRARRRDEVAACLAAPVGLSISHVRIRRRLGRAVDSSASEPAMRRLTSYLQGALRPDSAGTATLAVVAVGDVRSAAQLVAALAVSLAENGATVLVSDLAPGAVLARLLGAGGPGAGTVRLTQHSLSVAVPEPDDVTPAGPVSGHRAGHLPAAVAADLREAYHAADVLLTLTTLDPSFGAGHLGTWATSAVVLVTAGKASVTRLEATGEMIRLAGITEFSAVLVGADKDDESFGGGWRRYAEPVLSVPKHVAGAEAG